MPPLVCHIDGRQAQPLQILAARRSLLAASSLALLAARDYDRQGGGGHLALLAACCGVYSHLVDSLEGTQGGRVVGSVG